MANLCTGFVALYGERVTEAINYLRSIAKDNEGIQIIEDKDGRWLFDIEATDDGQINFWTKWEPDVNQIKALADMFGLGFEYEYDEPGCLIFGRHSYSQGDLEPTHHWLPDDSFDEFEYDEEKDVWVFRGEEWESDWEIKNLLLEEKMKEN